MVEAGGDQDQSVDAMRKIFVGPHGKQPAEREAHQVEAFVSQFVSQLRNEFSNLVAGKPVLECCGFSVPGQFEKIDTEPLSHELCQCAPVIKFRNSGWDNDERLALPGFQHVQP